MYYTLKCHDSETAKVPTIIRLFQHHQHCLEQLQVSVGDILLPKYSVLITTALFQLQESFAAAKKASRKKNDGDDLSGNLRVTAQVTAMKPENVWDLIALHGFLEAICR